MGLSAFALLLLLIAPTLADIKAADQSEEDGGGGGGADPPPKGPVVQTKFGQIEGIYHTTESGKTISAFLGVRYGQAPDSIFRFERAKPVDSWHGITHHARRFRAACVPFHEKALDDDKDYSEDCLFLNIFTPKLDKSASLPVLVYIHGGGFEIGDSSQTGFHTWAEHFVAHGVVVVSIQYRLGPFGFFTTGDTTLPGNMGLWDQMLALFFLHETIDSFGGDANRITLWGHSAGSASVAALTISPHTNFLFSQAIQMSGSSFAEFAQSEEVIDKSKQLSEALGCGWGKSERVKLCMQEKTAHDIIKAVDKIGSSRAEGNFLIFHPRHDEDFFSYSLEQMIKQAPPKPTILGVTDKDAGLFVFLSHFSWFAATVLPEEKWATFGKTDLETFIRQQIASEKDFGDQATTLQKLLIDFYVEKGKTNQPTFYLERYVDLLSDLIFLVPSLHELDLKRVNGWPVYFYIHTHYENTRGWPVNGSFHCAELPLLTDATYGKKGDFSEGAKRVQQHWVEAIRNFVIKSDPSPSAVRWLKVTADNPHQHIVFDENARLSRDGFREEAADLWLRKIPAAIGTDALRHKRLPAAHAYRIHTEL